MINYGKQSIDQQDIDAVTKVLKSNFITQGNEVGKFEKLLSNLYYYLLVQLIFRWK